MACQLSQSSPVNVTLGNFAENKEQLCFLMDMKEMCGAGTVGNGLGEEASLRGMSDTRAGRVELGKKQDKLGLRDITE